MNAHHKPTCIYQVRYGSKVRYSSSVNHYIDNCLCLQLHCCGVDSKADWAANGLEIPASCDCMKQDDCKDGAVGQPFTTVSNEVDIFTSWLNDT